MSGFSQGSDDLATAKERIEAALAATGHAHPDTYRDQTLHEIRLLDGLEILLECARQDPNTGSENSPGIHWVEGLLRREKRERQAVMDVFAMVFPEIDKPKEGR